MRAYTIEELGRLQHYSDKHDALIKGYRSNVRMLEDGTLNHDERVALVAAVEEQHCLLRTALTELPSGQYVLSNREKLQQSMSWAVEHNTPIYKRY